MKRAMEFHELPPIDDPRKTLSVVLEVRYPGIVRQTSVLAKPIKTSIITRAKDSPTVELVPVIIFEIDPDARLKKHHFSVSPPGAVIESQNSLEYRGSFLYPQGAIFFLFEEMIPWVHPDDKGKDKPSYCRRCGSGVNFWDAPDEGPCHCSEEQLEDFMKANPS